MLPLEYLVDCTVFCSDFSQDATDTFLIVLNSLFDLFHVEVRIADIFQQCSRIIIDLLQKGLGFAIRKYLIDEMSGEVFGMTVLIELVNHPYTFIDLPNFLGAFVGRDFNLEIILYNKSAFIRKDDQLLIEVVHEGFHDDNTYY